MRKPIKIRPRITLPKVIKSLKEQKNIENFPIRAYSYSTFVKFSTNPIMFKINYINGDRIETTRNISGVVGNSFHNAMEVYYEMLRAGREDSEAIKSALESGMECLAEYNDGFIEYSTTTPTKQKAQETFSQALSFYVQGKKHEEEEIITVEETIEEEIEVEYKSKVLRLPIPLKGRLDKLVRQSGKLKIKDYKTTRAFSDPEKIDGAKILQSIQYYFLVYARYGEAPYSMTFEEVKTTKNRDGGDQIREYEIIYDENDIFFDFYFRFYEDVTRSINGEAVFVPNINDFFDNEIAIIAYAYRLDVPEEQAKQMEKMRMDNITDLLKSRIQHAGNMRKLLKTAEKKFISAKNLNYNAMEIQERIKTKMMEHGMLISFDSKVEGNTVDLYRYNPSIGLKMSKIKNYVADVEQVTGVSGIRVLAPIPNTTLVGFEIPRKERVFPTKKPPYDMFNLAIGVDIMGDYYRFDIRKAPHLLVAGATGSGKSVFLNSIISQMLENKEIEMHLFDPKMVELGMFADRAKKYETDPEKIHNSLVDLVKEMNARYKKLSDSGARNIQEYEGKMKYKVVVIDEFGDLIISNIIKEEKIDTGEKYIKGEKAGQPIYKTEKTNISQEITKNILLLAQKARAAGIHIIIATQRPSTDIITGSIKANFPTKVAFRTAKEIDSRVLLDEPGAEKLLGRGDMIFSSDEGQIRLQGFNF